MFRSLSAEPRPIGDLPRRARLDPEEVEIALDKLWIHGGAVVEGEMARVGRPGWRSPYVRQREHRKEQLDEMLHFAESHGCRMLHLLRHFGDQEDRTRPCGRCDACAPQDTVLRRWRSPTRHEAGRLVLVLEALRQHDRPGTGQLHREVAGTVPERRELERLLGGLARAGLVRLIPDTFEKDGRTISFQRVSLTPSGRAAGPAEVEGVPLEETAPRAGPAAGRGEASRSRSPRADAGRRPVERPAGWSPTGRTHRRRSWRGSERGGSRRPGGAACPRSGSSATAPSSPSPRHARRTKGACWPCPASARSRCSATERPC